MIHDFWLCWFRSLSSQEKIISTLGHNCVCTQSLGHVWFFVSSWTAACRLPYPSLSPRVCSKSFPLSQWSHLIILSSVTPYPSPFNLSQNKGLFQWVSSLHQMTKALELQLQHKSFWWVFRVDRGKSGSSDRFYFLGLQNHRGWWL